MLQNAAYVHFKNKWTYKLHLLGDTFIYILMCVVLFFTMDLFLLKLFLALCHSCILKFRTICPVSWSKALIYLDLGNGILTLSWPLKFRKYWHYWPCWIMCFIELSSLLTLFYVVAIYSFEKWFPSLLYKILPLFSMWICIKACWPLCG